MNAIQQLCKSIEEKFPDVKSTLDEPSMPTGSWWLDLERSGHRVSIEWRPSFGYSIGAREGVSYGERGDEVYLDTESAHTRIAEILRKRAETHTPAKAALRDLRESRSLSQEDLAGLLMVTQGTVSKMERRSDMFVSTLRAAVEAMGGELEIVARFGKQSFELSQFGGEHQ